MDVHPLECRAGCSGGGHKFFFRFQDDFPVRSQVDEQLISLSYRKIRCLEPCGDVSTHKTFYIGDYVCLCVGVQSDTDFFSFKFWHLVEDGMKRRDGQAIHRNAEEYVVHGRVSRKNDLVDVVLQNLVSFREDREVQIQAHLGEKAHRHPKLS